jgi:hypothetical protein
MATLTLQLSGLTAGNGSSSQTPAYDLKTLRQQSWDWDRVVMTKR